MIDKTNIRPMLQSIPWLMDLTQDQLGKLEKISGFRLVEEGEKLYQEGDKDNLLYIVSEGSLGIEIYVPGHGQVRLYNAEPLDMIGWDSMTPVARHRITSITALKKCSLIYFDGTALTGLCEEDKELGYVIMRRLSNVVATRMLTMRLKLIDLFMQK
ncbi:MAG: Crp/Fnr family transcriptional regulator [Anaerolineaceae bacterium]|jgi:CRP-like cAMP-binding protein|nr:Crp/Fnr family transcriptional regulator [Anaerolineaceae bacterium]